MAFAYQSVADLMASSLEALAKMHASALRSLKVEAKLHMITFVPR